MSTEVQVVLCSCPSAGAEALARKVTESRLAACVNIVPGVTSVYRWEGAVETASESLLIIKTRSDQVQALQEALLEAHEYEVPEILALDVSSGAEAYLAWVMGEVRAPSLPAIEREEK